MKNKIKLRQLLYMKLNNIIHNNTEDSYVQLIHSNNEIHHLVMQHYLLLTLIILLLLLLHVLQCLLL